MFSMTLLSAGIGALLAAIDGAFDWPALVLAHASNNMVNDYFDVRHGVDTSDYPRANYAPHPIISGLVSVRGLWIAIVLCNVVELVIALLLAWQKGMPVMYFAVAGLAVSVFYVAPPLKLKHHGLGEIAIFAIWGPLMIAGTYYAITGRLPHYVWGASVPYGLAVMAVVMGKHLDKREKDEARGVHTLPVILGEKGGAVLMGALVLLTYLSTLALAAIEWLPWTSALVLVTLPRAIRVLRMLAIPMPKTPMQAFELAKDCIPADLKKRFNPDSDQNFPLWPLWYVVWGVWWVRFAGFWLVSGIALAIANRAFWGLSPI